MKFAAILFAGAAMFAAAGASAASLPLGTPVTLDFQYSGQEIGSETAAVAPGNEFSYFGNTLFDVNGGANGDEFVYTSTNPYCGVYCNGGRVQYTLTGLNFGTALTGFTILQNSFGPITIDSLTANSLSFSYDDTDINQGVNIVGRFETAAAAVPEPATWAMMLAGFGMIGFAARRRQSVKTTVRFA